MITRDFFLSLSGSTAEMAPTDERATVSSPRKGPRPFANLIDRAHKPHPVADRGSSASEDEQDSIGATEDAGSTSALSNIIPFPGPSVVIPFPTPVSEPMQNSSGGSRGWAAPGSPSVREALDDVEIDVPWPRLGIRSVLEERPSNIERVNFGPERPEPGLAGELTALPRPLPVAAALTQLPGDPAPPENSAGLEEGTGLGLEAKGGVVLVGKAATGAVSGEGLGGNGSRPEPTGIPVAKQEGGMDPDDEANNSPKSYSRTDENAKTPPLKNEKVPGPDSLSRSLNAMDWQAGRPIGNADRPAPVLLESVPTERELEAAATVERLSRMVVHETTLVRQHGSSSMSVLLRPDGETELFVHITLRNGQVQASVRCERGDFHLLNTLWPQLQESLAHQKVRLAGLQRSSSDTTSFFASPGMAAPWSGPGSGTDRRQTPEQQSLDERPAPASPESSSSTEGRRGRGSRQRLTTSRPGWETWA